MQAAAQGNVRFLRHSDQGGHSDGVQVMVHRGHAFIGHIFSGGFSVVDVRGPTGRRRLPSCRRRRTYMTEFNAGLYILEYEGRT